MHRLFRSIHLQFILQKYSDEAEATRNLLDLLLKKSNHQFDEFCSALHATEQTHVVKTQLITQGMCLPSSSPDFT